MKRRPSTGTTLALIALFVALTGTAIAGTGLITGRQIKNGTVGLVDLSPSARHALKGHHGAVGPAGPPGPPGPTGPQEIHVSYEVGPTVTQCADGGGSCQAGSSAAVCPTGSVVVGGGFTTSVPEDVVASARMIGAASYSVSAVNFWSAPATLQAYAVCMKGGMADNIIVP